MKIKDIYEYAEKIGVLVFSTIYEDEVHSRVAHFNGYDEEGIYFRTMSNKPYGRQLMNTKKVTVCGCTDTSIIGHQEDGTPIFPPSYSFRLIGEVKNVPEEVIREKAKTNKMLQTAVQDIDKYPAMADGNFVIYKGKCKKVCTFKAIQEGSPYEVMANKCDDCGSCLLACPVGAIEPSLTF